MPDEFGEDFSPCPFDPADPEPEDRESRAYIVKDCGRDYSRLYFVRACDPLEALETVEKVKGWPLCGCVHLKGIAKAQALFDRGEIAELDTRTECALIFEAEHSESGEL